MQVGNVTTPVGRRPMTLALVKRQLEAAQIKSGKTADKCKRWSGRPPLDGIDVPEWLRWNPERGGVHGND